MTQSRFLKAFEISLAAAELHRAEGREDIERVTLGSIIEDAWRASVREERDRESGIRWLADAEISGHIDRLLELDWKSLSVRDLWSGAHVAILVERRAIAIDFLKAFLARTRKRGLWLDYYQGLLALLNREAFIPTIDLDVRRRFDDRVYVPYVQLMHCISTGSDTGSALEGVRESFAFRHRDRRWQDMSMLDGDVELPINWDLRLAAIELAARPPMQASD